MKVQYHPAIEDELRDIIGYYNECYPGLGQQFLQEFERQVLKILKMPYRFSVYNLTLRVYKLLKHKNLLLKSIDF